MDERTKAMLLFEAIRSLGIDVPVMRTEFEGEGVRLYLYGGRVVYYSPDDGKSSASRTSTAPETARVASSAKKSELRSTPKTTMAPGGEPGRPTPEAAMRTAGKSNAGSVAEYVHPAQRDLARRRGIAVGKMGRAAPIRALRESR